MTGRIRVINLGLPKSGTTTLAKALRSAKFKVADWRVKVPAEQNKGQPTAFVAQLMYEDHFGIGDPLHRLDKWDAFTEISVAAHGHNLWPQMDWGLLRSIADHHSGARFLLSWRDPQKHYDSMMRWSNLGKSRLPKFAIPGLPAGFGYEPRELCHWIEGHSKFCRQMFAGDPRFLEFDISDPTAPDQIGDFLGRKIKWWGKQNVNVNDEAVSA